MPYSDNLYSIDSDDEYPDVEPLAGHGTYLALSQQQGQPLASSGTRPLEWDEDPDNVLSPADGNFPARHTDLGATRTPGTSPYYAPHVPHVPNVMVSDPSLEQGSTAESKAREARQERKAAAATAAADDEWEASSLVNTSSANPDEPASSSRAASPHFSSAHHPTSSTSSRATHYQPSTAGAYSSYSPSTTSHNISHAPRRSIYTPASPFFPREAPPAYTPSPTTTYTGSTSPTSPTASSQGHSSLSTNYQTFWQPSMGRSEETRGLLAQPESMGGPPDDDFGNVAPTWRDRVTRAAPYLSWRNCRYAAVCLVLLLLAGGFLIDGIVSVEKDLKPKDPPGSDPSKSPAPEPPHMDYPPYDGDLSWSVSGRCSGKPLESVSSALPVNYGPGHSVSIVQNVTEPDRHYDTHEVHVSGDVIIRRTGQGSPAPSFTVEMLKNDEAIHVAVDWDSQAQSLHLGVPRRLPDMDTVARPCIELRITLWVPGHAVLDTLSVDSIHLGIRLMDNLALRVAQHSQLSSVIGPIVSATDGTDKAEKLVEDSAPDYYDFDSRVIEVSSTSADITGYWPMYDYLGVSSVSGDIKVRVAPKEELKDAPKPATLNSKSVSGDIEIWEPLHKALSSSSDMSSASHSPDRYIPLRDYRTNIQTQSGKITGAVAFSSTCRIHSTSGDSQVELLPVLHASDADSDSASNLETSTISGDTKLQVREPLWIKKDRKGYLPPHNPGSSALPPPVGRDDGPEEEEDEKVIPVGDVGAGHPYLSLPLPRPHHSRDLDPLNSQSRSPPALRCLKSRHSSTSADIQLSYPASWEGELDLGTMSGSLKVSGEGVRVIGDGSRWPGINKHLVARKGADGGAAASIKTMSGDVRVVVGE